MFKELPYLPTLFFLMMQIEMLADMATAGQCIASCELINQVADRPYPCTFSSISAAGGTLTGIDPLPVCSIISARLFEGTMAHFTKAMSDTCATLQFVLFNSLLPCSSSHTQLQCLLRQGRFVFHHQTGPFFKSLRQAQCLCPFIESSHQFRLLFITG